MNELSNIVLIGMPGSGKTEVGKLLAVRLGRSFTDIDQRIEERCNTTISELFTQYGEAHFRDLETQATQGAALEQGIVISTGGGVVLRPRNMGMLKHTGVLFFLDRKLEYILADSDLSDRPLLQQNREQTLNRLYQERIVLYRKYADYVIDNNQRAEDAVRQIETIIRKGGV